MATASEQLAQYGYDPRSRRYRNRSNGRYLSAKEVRSAVDAVIDAQTLKMRALAEQLVAGQISLGDWQMQSAALLKTLHVSLGLAANGGLANTSAADLGFIASQIKQQYTFLREFALQIRRGTQALDGTLVSRAALYTQAGRETYQNVVARAARNGGMTEERSILGPADHCPGCLGEAKKGWQKIGTLIPIGSRQCKANDRCYMEYR